VTGTGGRLIRVPESAPHDEDAEQAILGAVLLGGGRVAVGLAEEGLAPEHFHRTQYGVIFRAMLALERAGEGIDTLTVHAWLQKHGEAGAAGGTAELEALAGAVPDVANWRSYGARVVELARWRGFTDACVMGLEAVSSLDADRREAVKRVLLDDGVRDSDSLQTPERLADRFWDWLDDRERKVIETPFGRLNTLLQGGLRPGGTTIIAAWTSMGKSVLVDQILEHARHQGYQACAYINEMSEEERTARTVAARTGVPFEKILGRDMTPAQWKRVVDSLPGLPFAIQPCAGWTAEEIGAHVRRHRWGIFAVDLATLIPAHSTADWAEVSKQLTIAARRSGSHGLIVVQLNHQRDTAGDRPPPALRDLKWGGHWADDAANVLFVHRNDVELAPGVFEPGADGHLRLAKARNGRTGLLAVSLDPVRLRFEDDAFARAAEWAA
jgi:replicative DNA helicase